MTPALALAAVLLLVVTAGACGGKGSRDAGASAAVVAEGATTESSRPARSLRRPAPLPKLARAVLDENMLEHGDHMEDLLWSSLMVDYETTRVLADSMGRAPRISRPPAGEDVLNAVFPPRFFELQDELYLAIEALGAAAAAKQDSNMADAYARLATTCVTCHSIYLQTGLPGSPRGATAP